MAERREFLKGALVLSVGGLRMTPGEARAASVPYRVLTGPEARLLDKVGEVLVPGARAAGLSHYVDDQLAAPPADSLLMLRYFDIPPPWTPFYRGALAALDAHARARTGKGFDALSADEASTLVAGFAGAPAADWPGPPSPLVYLVLRSDAVDVVWGTEAGFAALGVEYMAHIPPPPRKW